ncbi:hypothetical protein VTN00DRAFT_4618 [Thermoascus crustaceus]|uniref:uncharacterized protein n=1 Tax=Thermoascus crustaceus TaxID=5088 RepID=UPI0037430187
MLTPPVALASSLETSATASQILHLISPVQVTFPLVNLTEPRPLAASDLSGKRQQTSDILNANRSSNDPRNTEKTREFTRPICTRGDTQDISRAIKASSMLPKYTYTEESTSSPIEYPPPPPPSPVGFRTSKSSLWDSSYRKCV